MDKDFQNYAITLIDELKNDCTTSVCSTQRWSKAETEMVIAGSLVANTRGYIERVVAQINGTYENGWYDGCAVMIRRLLETLIVEAFENYKIASKIQNPKQEIFTI